MPKPLTDESMRKTERITFRATKEQKHHFDELQKSGLKVADSLREVLDLLIISTEEDSHDPH